MRSQDDPPAARGWRYEGERGLLGKLAGSVFGRVYPVVELWPCLLVVALTAEWVTGRVGRWTVSGLARTLAGLVGGLFLAGVLCWLGRLVRIHRASVDLVLPWSVRVWLLTAQSYSGERMCGGRVIRLRVYGCMDVRSVC